MVVGKAKSSEEEYMGSEEIVACSYRPYRNAHGSYAFRCHRSFSTTAGRESCPPEDVVVTIDSGCPGFRPLCVCEIRVMGPKGNYSRCVCRKRVLLGNSQLSFNNSLTRLLILQNKTRSSGTRKPHSSFSSPFAQKIRSTPTHPHNVHVE